MSKIVELAEAIELELEENRSLMEAIYNELQNEKQKNKEFKRRLVQLLDDFYPDY